MRGILANKKILAVVILVILLFTAYWLNGRSTLEITIINTSGNQAVSYALYNQGSKKTISFQSSSATVKKTVSRASYEVSVIQEQKSYFTVVKTKGFFGKTTLEVNLAEEKGRKFHKRRQWIPWSYLPKKDVHGRESRRGAATKL